MLDAIRRYENWLMDLPALVGLPMLMITVAVPILFAVVLVLALVNGWDEREMAKLHCRATGQSRQFHVSAHPVLVGKTMMMMPARDGVEYEYSCDDGYRWR